MVTDHNTILGGLEAKEINPGRVIIGEEIMTTEGELLAFFVKRNIPPYQDPMETITQLRDQGAFISVSHPFDRFRKGSWRLPVLLQILPYIDAIETFNARCLWPGFNHRAQDFARKHHLLGTIGSDAHTTFELGRATLLLPPFHDAESLKESLKKAESARISLSLPWVHLSSRYANWRKRRNRGDTK
ncbi:MAG: PHP domain-containing protein [Anaerolineales bacterium]|jgi:hypothetical protein